MIKITLRGDLFRYSILWNNNLFFITFVCISQICGGKFITFNPLIMTRSLALLSLAFVIAVFFSACQKESLIFSNQNDDRLTFREDEEPELLPCETECIDPDEKGYFPDTYSQDAEWGPNTKTVTLTVYNTEEFFVFEVSSTNGYAHFLITELGIQHPGPFDPDETGIYFLPLPEDWQACDLIEYEVVVVGDGPQVIFNFQYYLVGVCPDDCVWREETAFGGEGEGNGPAWWFYFDTYDFDGVTPLVQPIYAGQQLTDGTVTWDGENLVIDLGSWSLQDVEEPVKVQGYDNLPNKRPAAGKFTTYKGSDLIIPGDGSRYYVIHLDVQICEDVVVVEDEDEEIEETGEE